MQRQMVSTTNAYKNTSNACVHARTRMRIRRNYSRLQDESEVSDQQNESEEKRPSSELSPHEPCSPDLRARAPRPNPSAPALAGLELARCSVLAFPEANTARCGNKDMPLESSKVSMSN